MKQAGKQTMAGVGLMILGSIMTPVCPAVGPVVFNVGLGYSVGSTAAAGGYKIGEKISKIWSVLKNWMYLLIIFIIIFIINNNIIIIIIKIM